MIFEGDMPPGSKKMTSKNSYFGGSCAPNGPPKLIPWSWASFWLSLVHWGHSGTLVLIIFFRKFSRKF